MQLRVRLLQLQLDRLRRRKARCQRRHLRTGTALALQRLDRVAQHRQLRRRVRERQLQLFVLAPRLLARGARAQLRRAGLLLRRESRATFDIRFSPRLLRRLARAARPVRRLVPLQRNVLQRARRLAGRRVARRERRRVLRSQLPQPLAHLREGRGVSD